MALNILRIDASARTDESQTRLGVDKIAQHIGGPVVTRDLTLTPPTLVTQDIVGAYFTPAEDRTEAQNQSIAPSNAAVAELEAADLILIGAPIYNFGVPASLKGWADMVARVGRTFKYTENGPVGLLSSKRAIVVVASGGTEVGSAVDFATPWLRFFLSFIGIKDVTILTNDQIDTWLKAAA